MSEIDFMDDKRSVFGAVSIVANRLDTLLERELKEYDVTTKQWLLSVVVDNLYSQAPTMKDVAREMGSSHQNIKQVALKLEQKGLLVFEKDRKDARVTRLKLSDQSYEFWAKTQAKAIAFTEALFEGVEKDELSKARVVIQKMLSNLTQMDKN